MKAALLVVLFLASTVFSAAAMLALGACVGDEEGFPGAMTPSNRTSPEPVSSDPGFAVYSRAGYDITPLPRARVDELARKLTRDEAEVILSKGTERAFCGNLVDNHKDGVYTCKLCGLPLFSSEHKFDSGTGWPSFFQPFDKAHVREKPDHSYLMERTEILCTRCGAHLGHVFEDGPRPTGLRFCLNSIALNFTEKGSPLPPESSPVRTETAYFAGGCFWGVEDRFQNLPGVIDAVSGYMGGHVANPTYEMVCRSDTGHAETVRVTFDPARISYAQLLAAFFRFHNPTTLNRQGPDVGPQYRSAIFAATDEQLAQANAFIAEQQQTGRFAGRKIVTQVARAADAGAFYEAEAYHQDYHERHGGSCALPE